MKFPLLWSMVFALALLTAGRVSAQGGAAAQAEMMRELVPPPVIASAVEAVSALGDAVVQGRYKVALDRMNPKWKERTARRVGGMEVLESRLEAVAGEMVKQGVTMMFCRPQGEPRGHGVAPAWTTVRRGGTETRRLVATQWLVLVPTVTRFRLFQKQPDGGPPQRIQIESTGYQVAVADRDKLDWTFIDGAGLTVNELRSLFITLPQDLELPPVEKRQIR